MVNFSIICGETVMEKIATHFCLFSAKRNCKVLSNRPQVSEIQFILPRMEIFGATSGGNVNENGGGVNIGMSSVWGMAMPSPKPPSPSPSPPPSLTEPWSVGSQKRYFLSDAAAANDTRHSSRIQLNFITITISVSMSVSAASRFFSNRFHSGLLLSLRFFARTVFFGPVPFFFFSFLWISAERVEQEHDIEILDRRWGSCYKQTVSY